MSLAMPHNAMFLGHPDYHTAPLDPQSLVPLDPNLVHAIPCNTPTPSSRRTIVIDVTRPSCMVFRFNKTIWRMSTTTVRHTSPAHRHHMLRVSKPNTTQCRVNPRHQMSLDSTRTLVGITVHTAKPECLLLRVRPLFADTSPIQPLESSAVLLLQYKGRASHRLL
jgi:hypothetical protein